MSAAGAILSGVAGSAALAQQDIVLFNPAGTAVTYTTGAFTADGGTWLKVTPSNGTLNQTGAGTITIQASLASIPTGVVFGTVQVAFGEGTVRTIELALIAIPAAAPAAGGQSQVNLRSVAAASCNNPTKLVPKFAKPDPLQNVFVAESQLLRVVILDDCNNPLTKGNGGGAQVTFSNVDKPVNLIDQGSGIWEGSWNPVTAQAQVTVQVFAVGAATAISRLLGAASIQVQALPANTNAAPQPLGAVNAASFDKQNAGLVAPGSYVAIYGVRLADDTAPANAAPLPVDLLNTSLLMGDQRLPLSYASPGQVNGLIPQRLVINTDHQLVIRRGDTVSTPVQVTVTDLQPGIFTQAQTGNGQGSILISGTALVAGPVGAIRGQQPVKRGDYIEIYCTGLGPVRTDDGTLPPCPR